MATTRRGFCTLVTLALAGSAGCLDTLTGGEPTRFVAPPAPVADDALAETDYEHQATEQVEETRTFEVAGQSRDVEVVNVRSEYQKAIDMGPLGETRGAVFGTLSTPAVEVLGRTFNPVEEMDNREIAEEVQSQYEEISIGEEIDRRTLRVLGDEVELSKFEGQATFSDLSIDVFVHTGIAESDDEYVVVLAIYPQLLSGEEGTIVAMAEGVVIEE